MMSVELCDAASTGNIAEVIRLIEECHVDPSSLHPVLGMKAIEFAACNGHLDIIEYLISHEANLKMPRDYNLLFWIASCQDKDKRQSMLRWLNTENRYQQLQCNIQKEHIQAALGELPQTENLGTQDDQGFFPCYYAVLANEDPQPWYSEAMEAQACLEKAKGLSVAMLLICKFPQKLEQFLIGKKINLNAKPLAHEHPDQGVTIAFRLILINRIDILEKYLNAYPDAQIDLNAAPLSGKDRGVTVALALILKKRIDILENYLNAHPDAELNLNAQPLESDHASRGITIAQILILGNRINILIKLIQNPNAKIDFLSPLAFPNREQSISILEIVFEKDPIAFKKMIETIEMRNREEFYAITNHFQDSQPNHIYDCCQLVNIVEDYRGISIATDSEDKNIQRVYKEMFAKLRSIDKTSTYYRDAQSLMGHILFDQANNPILVAMFVELLTTEIEDDSALSNNEYKLRFLLEKFLNRGYEDDRVMLRNLVAKTYQQLEEKDQALQAQKAMIAKLQKEIDQLKKHPAGTTLTLWSATKHK